MTRRGKGEGTIYPRKDGRWEASLTLPTVGKRERRSFYGKTHAEVAKKLRDAQKRQDDNLPLPSEKLTVAAFLKQWLDGKANLRPESRRRYDDSIRLHIVPTIGKRILGKLTPADLQLCYLDLRARRLSGTTISLVHGVLHTALDDAAKWGMVIRNVADLVESPRRSTPEMRTLSAEEAAQLLLASKGDTLEALFVVALTCGLRLGELQALRWRDIDLERRRLWVRATFQGMKDGYPILAEPKTAKSKREVYLSEVAVEALRNHRGRQVEQRLLVGALWQNHDMVFANSFGRPVDGNNIRERSFKRLLKAAGLPPMRFHNLRHGAATLLMAEGVPIKVISEMLGHADITTTLRIYAHVLPSMQEQAAAAMDRMFL